MSAAPNQVSQVNMASSAGSANSASLLNSFNLAGPKNSADRSGHLFDTHCHLDAGEFDADRDQVIAAACAAGVRNLIIPAVEVANFAAVKALCQKASSAGDDLQKIVMYAAYGIHPMYTPRAQEADIAVLRHWLVNEGPVAVGEIGLDGWVPGLDMARQEWFFVEQLKLASEFDLPVLLHIRRAQDLVLKHLRKIRVKGGIAHAFNGSRQQADMFIDLGFKLGFGGAMTFEGSSRIRKLAAELPLDSLVIETDAPDIPPAWVAGRNTPAELERIAATLASLRHETVDTIRERTERSAFSVIGR